VLGARRAERIQALASELNNRGGKALDVPTDVTDYAQVKNLVDSAVKTYGRVDVILNNAGVGGDICEYRVFCNQSTGGRGHQRDSVPPDKTGALVSRR
jgi:NAD(P)-dependent dehydrogenase (short-subunit alcohol dehydrogenase family)